MRDFADIYAIAVERKGGKAAVESLLPAPKSRRELAATPEDRWLSCMTRCIFQAGFNWKVVAAKWPDFETAFDGFDIHRCALYSDDDLARLASDARIIRNGRKIAAVRHNAVFLLDLVEAHGSAGAFFAAWPGEDFVGLLDLLKKRGHRLGGTTGQYFLRFMGVDGFILTKDVVARLVAEGVIDGPPTAKRALAAVQTAFNVWHEQSGRSLSAISRVLSLSVD